jgi:hypothetical protein
MKERVRLFAKVGDRLIEPGQLGRDPEGVVVGHRDGLSSGESLHDC